MRGVGAYLLGAGGPERAGRGVVAGQRGGANLAVVSGLKEVRARPSMCGVRGERAGGLIRKVASERALWAAWARVAAGSGMPGSDGVTVERYSRRLDERLTELGSLLASGGYETQPLRPVTVEPPAGRSRQLGVATVRDRVAQRSFVDVAGRVLDAEAAEASFGYRRGRSWLDALRQVEQHRDSGLRWVSRADIHRFFDEVDHAVLEDRLARTFVAEPAVVTLAMKWATAPLLGPNGIAERHRGLPLRVLECCGSGQPCTRRRGRGRRWCGGWSATPTISACAVRTRRVPCGPAGNSRWPSTQSVCA